jgi:hypothetical protein
MGSGGPATAGLFELKSRAQYLFSSRGNAKFAAGSRIVTRLNNLSTGQSLDICGADAGLGMTERFVVVSNASLLLQPGVYSWISEIKPNPNDAIDDIALISSVANSPEPIETRGIREAFSVVSGTQGRRMFARGYFDTAIGSSEYLSAQLVVKNLTTGQQFASPVVEMIGNATNPNATGVVPYDVVADQLFLAQFTINYTGAGRVSCLLRQTWDHE